MQTAALTAQDVEGVTPGRKTLRLHTLGARIEGREAAKPLTAARDGFSLTAAGAKPGDTHVQYLKSEHFQWPGR